MLISLDWIRDYVDLPSDVDPRALAEELTVTTAEVEGVEQIDIAAKGLVVAKVLSVAKIPGSHLHEVKVDLGDRQLDTVSAATTLTENAQVIYAPPGASVATLGEINESTVADRPSQGMVLPGDALGIELAALEPVFVGAEFSPGDAIPESLFNDWIVEVDNKSLTHRPDLWGHYGMAREFAAIFKKPLKEFPVVAQGELEPANLPEIPITIADGTACRRYSGLMLGGVPTQPAPLWMQLRLGRTGMRPISALVDLTNYIMADLGQPMHAFDAAKVSQIEVDWAKADETFKTLDGMDRKLIDRDLMILTKGNSVALAGVMGGEETEVVDSTETLLLESANFDPATVRRTATRLGLRTDASARFEKSLDPVHTVLAIQRFVYLARDIYPALSLQSKLSDAYPGALPAVSVNVDPDRTSRVIGRPITHADAAGLLEPLGFNITEKNGSWEVGVPSYRATNDISIEADVIEELARFIGYQAIAPSMPTVTMRRFDANPLHGLTKKTLQHFTGTEGFHEIFGYLWYDAAWMKQLEIDRGDCIELRNPAAEGLDKFRKSLIPGMLAATAKNRFNFPAFSLIEMGSVFPGRDDSECHHTGLICAARGKKVEDSLVLQLKAALESWAWQSFSKPIAYQRTQADTNCPWEHPQRTASLWIGDTEIGRLSVIDVALRRRMDEHMAAWAIAWAELRLDALTALGTSAEVLAGIPAFPQVDMDFSLLVPAQAAYADVASSLREFTHPLLKLIRFVDSYEGKSIGEGKRSLTFRLVAGDSERTLAEEDTDGFRNAFEKHVTQCGFELRV
ncbi:MAG: phenylalanine--tRNA ligase subunit beta [Phycisphaerae bacterium]